LADAEKRGIVPVPDEFAWPMVFNGVPRPPKGWCILDWRADETEINADLTSRTPEPLKKLLGKDGPQQYIAFHQDKPVYLVKTAEARKALVAAGVIAKPEPRKRAESSHEKAGSSQESAQPGTPTPQSSQKKPAEPTKWEIDDRAVLLAARDIRDCAEANFESLAPLAANGGPETDAAYEAMQFVGRVLIRDWLDVGTERLDVLREYLPGMKEEYGSVNLRESAAKVYAAAIADATPQRMLGFLLHLCTSVVLADPSRFAAADGQSLKDWLLGHYDVSWDACRETAEMELKREMNEPQEAA
jgi:hypothetical protein